MFMHLQGSGVGHKAMWNWREFLKHDSGARTGGDGGAGAADSDDMTDLEGRDKVYEQELDSGEEPEDGKGENKDGDEEQQVWDGVMRYQTDNEDNNDNAEGLGDDSSDSEEEEDEDDFYGLEGYGAL